MSRTRRESCWYAMIDDAVDAVQRLDPATMQLATGGRAIDAYDDFKDIVEQLLSAYKTHTAMAGRLVGPQVALRPPLRRGYPATCRTLPPVLRSDRGNGRSALPDQMTPGWYVAAA